MDPKFTPQVRTLDRIIEAVVTSDGAGVRLRRSIGRSTDARVDPFLMLVPRAARPVSTIGLPTCVPGGGVSIVMF